MDKTLSQKISLAHNSDKLPWIIISVGIILRLIRYLHNPSLWFDESDIAIDVINRSFADLIHPSPDYTQAYPFAFLLAIKLSAQVLGNYEQSLRLFPLLAGVTALFLFYKVAKYYIKHRALIIALGLFAVLDSLIMQSSNLKPYSSDLAFALLIYFLAAYILSKELNLLRVMMFGIAGALIVWFSNPSIFVLAGIGICLALFSIINKEWGKTVKYSMVFLIWLLSFYANYHIYLLNLKANFGRDMEGMLLMENAYMPLPPASLADIKWFTDLFFEIFRNPLDMTLSGIAALLFLVGSLSVYGRNKSNFFILISPIALTFIAAALHQYPFKGRFIFFLLPSMLLFVAEGAEYIRAMTVDRSAFIGIALISLLFFHPLTTSAYRVIKPFYYEDIKPVMHYIKDNWREGDVLYVHYYAQYPFEYYSHYYPETHMFTKNEYVIGIAPRGWYRHWKKKEVSERYGTGDPFAQSNTDIFKTYTRDLDRLKGKKRVWVLFTTEIMKDGISEEKFFVHHFEGIGRKLDSYGKPGVSSAYLYDLSKDTAPDQ